MLIRRPAVGPVAGSHMPTLLRALRMCQKHRRSLDTDELAAELASVDELRERSKWRPTTCSTRCCTSFCTEGASDRQRLPDHCRAPVIAVIAGLLWRERSRTTHP
jgi:hypothetical protein